PGNVVPDRLHHRLPAAGVLPDDPDNGAPDDDRVRTGGRYRPDVPGPGDPEPDGKREVCLLPECPDQACKVLREVVPHTGHPLDRDQVDEHRRTGEDLTPAGCRCRRGDEPDEVKTVPGRGG